MGLLMSEFHYTAEIDKESFDNKTQQNARFWTLCNGGWVKITLRPGQTLTHFVGGPTDEGWHMDSESWSHDGEYIERVCISDGSDCDGRLTRSTVLRADINTLAEIPCKEYKTVYYPGFCRDEPVECGFSRPDWYEVDSSQYDQFAQAMNY